MREPKDHLYLSHEEVRLIIQVLIDKRNKLIQMGKYTDAVDDLIIKVMNAKTVKLKVVITFVDGSTREQHIVNAQSFKTIVSD